MGTFAQKQNQAQRGSARTVRSNTSALPARFGAFATEETDEMAEREVSPSYQFDLGRINVATPQTPHKPTGPQSSGQRMPFLDIIQRSFGRHDISHIQANTARDAAMRARAMGAEAFTEGSKVTFFRQPDLHTAAHEAAHVVQQHAGVRVPGGVGREEDEYERHADEVAYRVTRGQSSEALLDATPGVAGPILAQAPASQAPVIQMRRIPPNIRALLSAMSGANGPNFAANAEGAQLLIDRALSELTLLERLMVDEQSRGGMKESLFNTLPLGERLIKQAEAILLVRGLSLQLGDPGLIDTGPRPGTTDAANITKVVDKANTVFADIASGARDAWIKDVFGAANVASAKAKYARGRTAMNRIHGANKIVTDRSRYSEEVWQGGLTDPPSRPVDPNQKIRVAKGVIDAFEGPDPVDPVALTQKRANENAATVTLIHESLHAGNDDVGDDLYIGAPAFQSQTGVKKLKNSAHFEVVPWRILDPLNPRAFAVDPPTIPATFQVFVPAGTTVGGVTAPALTKAEEGTKAAYEFFNRAWALGLNLHLEYLQLFRKPTDWTVPQFGGSVRFNNSLPFWSKVQKLTIHKKTDIDPRSSDEAKHPVSQIDLGLSEGLTRKLASAMRILKTLQKEADTLQFEADHSTHDERTATFPGDVHDNADKERDFLMKLVVRNPNVAPLTGTVDRDLRVVKQQGDPTLDDFVEILKPRNPNSFPD